MDFSHPVLAGNNFRLFCVEINGGYDKILYEDLRGLMVGA
jgi:hypothetical protein